MKKILFALFGLVLLASSCTKEESIEEPGEDTNYFVRFRAGTEVREYRDIVLALRSTNAGMNTVSIQGQENLTGTTPGLIIVITESDPIIAKKYEENANSDSPALLYRDNSANEFSNLFMTTASGFSVTLSDINEKTVRGTFSGKVSDLNGTELDITEGSFYAKFQ